jgi:hypothetical protein
VGNDGEIADVIHGQRGKLLVGLQRRSRCAER